MSRARASAHDLFWWSIMAAAFGMICIEGVCSWIMVVVTIREGLR